ncbi:MAG TPA: hypothetical protein DCS66_10720 [Flavobacteriaceae bacterium]|nr:hypothetical protein [Flavobacteriaceae bacterium]HAT65058.1 hypothetical protein [Flavobacteriaceae bacterium]
MNEKVTLISSHIFLDSELVKTVFNNIHYAYVTYVKAQERLLITPVSSQWFVKMYEPTQFLLKSRNLKGDRTIAIREILIDNDLDMTDRVLDFEVIEKTNLIKVNI